MHDFLDFIARLNVKSKIALGITVFIILLLVMSFAYRSADAPTADAASVAASDTADTAAASIVDSTAQPVRETAPDFTLPDAAGKPVSLSASKGSPVVLHFWTSWYAPCQKELPDFEALYQAYRDKGVVFMMVNLTDGDKETTATATAFLQQNHYDFPVYFDVDLTAAGAYSLSAIPVSIFIDREGKIVHAYHSVIDAATMKRSVEELLQ